MWPLTSHVNHIIIVYNISTAFSSVVIKYYFWFLCYIGIFLPSRCIIENAPQLYFSLHSYRYKYCQTVTYHVLSYMAFNLSISYIWFLGCLLISVGTYHINVSDSYTEHCSTSEEIPMSRYRNALLVPSCLISSLQDEKRDVFKAYFQCLVCGWPICFLLLCCTASSIIQITIFCVWYVDGKIL